MEREAETKGGLAAVVTATMQEHGLTLRDLADQAAIPTTTLHRTLQGGRAFTVPELQRIAKALGTTAPTLMAQAEDVAA